MEPRVYRLADGRQIGAAALEVVSFPSAAVFGASAEERSRRLYQSFTQLATELHKLCGKGACLEMLWITEKATSQAFASSVRIFYILRKIGTQQPQVQRELELLMRSLTTSLSAMQYHVEEADPLGERLTGLLSGVDPSCTLGIVKREDFQISSNAVMPYYTTDIFPLKNSMNFNGIISTMSQLENCCISFQLFPTALEPAETAAIHEMMSTLSQISTGVMMGHQMYRDPQAGAPLKYYGFYDANNASPMFQYSVLVFGSRDDCNALAAKAASQIQSGSEKISACDLRYADLSAAVQLPKQLLTYVWAAHSRMMAAGGREQIYQAFPVLQVLRRLPHLVTAEEAASFFRLPAHERSMPALRSNQHVSDVEQFAEGVVDPNNIQFGSLMQSEAGSITIGSPPGAFAKHALIVGMPGSGKTTFSVHLLLQFAKKGIPFLAIEPTKTEYRGMIDAIDGLRIFTPGKNSVSPFVINPFVPPKGIRLEQYIYGLSSAFQAAFSMPSPLDIIFQRAIQESYNRYGWKDYSTIDDPDVRVFGMHEFVLVFKDLMKHMNYSKEIMGNIESAGVLRLTTLIERNGNIYDTVQSVPIEDLLSAPTVLELNAIDNREEKALIMALLLIQIGLYTKNNQLGDGKLKKIMLIDEAHVLLGGGGGNAADGKPDAHASSVQAIQDLIVEIRSYGTGIIIADQAPSQVSRPVVANTDIKIAFRLVENTEKKIIADTTNMSDEAMEQLSRLKPGEAFAYYQRLDTPQLIKTEEIREEEGIRLSVPDEEIARRGTYWKTHRSLLRPYAECDLCPYCRETCDFTVRSDADHLARTAFRKYSDAIKNNEHLKKCILNLPFLMKQEFAAFQGERLRRLIICTRIRLYRKIVREKPMQLQAGDKREAISALPRALQNRETEG